MDITSSRKHVIYDNLVHFLALSEMLSSDDVKDLITSLNEACDEDDKAEIEFISACEKYIITKKGI